jgi:hypothetical protein
MSKSPMSLFELYESYESSVDKKPVPVFDAREITSVSYADGLLFKTPISDISRAQFEEQETKKRRERDVFSDNKTTFHFTNDVFLAASIKSKYLDNFPLFEYIFHQSSVFSLLNVLIRNVF